MSKSTAVIVAAHGEFAEGILSTVKMIAGEFENVKHINFLDSDNYDTLDEKYKEAFNELSDYEHYIIITDLLGGTPFNRAVMNYGEREDVRVLSGLNFASLFTAITGQDDNIDSLVEEILAAGLESIQKYSTKADEDNETEDFDGI